MRFSNPKSLHSALTLDLSPFSNTQWLRRFACTSLSVQIYRDGRLSRTCSWWIFLFYECTMAQTKRQRFSPFLPVLPKLKLFSLCNAHAHVQVWLRIPVCIKGEWWNEIVCNNGLFGNAIGGKIWNARGETETFYVWINAGSWKVCMQMKRKHAHWSKRASSLKKFSGMRFDRGQYRRVTRSFALFEMNLPECNQLERRKKDERKKPQCRNSDFSPWKHTSLIRWTFQDQSQPRQRRLRAFSDWSDCIPVKHIWGYFTARLKNEPCKSHKCIFYWMNQVDSWKRSLGKILLLCGEAQWDMQSSRTGGRFFK